MIFGRQTLADLVHYGNATGNAVLHFIFKPNSQIPLVLVVLEFNKGQAPKIKQNKKKLLNAILIKCN